MAPASRQSVTRIGHYQVLRRIASGGMGTVHMARKLGDAGFARLVAIKFLHPHLAGIPEFVVRFLEEARLAARIRHANVVSTIDVVQEGATLCLVMEYVPGESVSALLGHAAQAGERIPEGVAVRIVVDTLRGLGAAHLATGDDGTPLKIVHRDVSPQNVLVGLDGAAHLLDFGIAKAAGSLQTTAEGHLKGKLRYMAPEQILGEDATVRSDIYAASVVLWELLANRRLFEAANDAALLAKVLDGAVLPPSHFGASRELDDVVLRGLARNPSKRPESAEQMARELERFAGIVSAGDVASWVERLAGTKLREREREATLGSDGEVEQSGLSKSDVAHVVTATASGVEKPLGRTAWLVGAPSLGASASVDETFLGPSRRRPLFFGAAAAVLTVLAVTAVSASLKSRGGERTSSEARAPSPTASGIVTVVSAADSASAPAPPAPPVAMVSTTASPSPAPRRPTIKPAAKLPTTPDCSTPYFRDESGIRRVRRECL